MESILKVIHQVKTLKIDLPKLLKLFISYDSKFNLFAFSPYCLTKEAWRHCFGLEEPPSPLPDAVGEQLENEWTD